MSARIAILGATGVYGRHLLPRLVAAGHRVRALVRTPAAATIASACGAELAVADIFDEAALRVGLAGCDVAINLATSLPGPRPGGDYARNDQLRREGTPIWVRAYVSLVHLADVAAATVAAVGRWPSRQALIIADDRPAQWRDIFMYVCALVGSDPPQPGGRALMPSFRVKNHRARESLSWAPTYTDYRAGLVR